MSIFKPYNKEEIRKLLPKGYTPIESLPASIRIPSPLLRFGKFPTYEQAKRKAIHLWKQYHSADYDIAVDDNIGCYYLVVPEGVKGTLNKADRKILEKSTYVVKSTINMPDKLYRFIDPEYVDKFFKTGELMLTTFARCKKLEESSRKDEDEGAQYL